MGLEFPHFWALSRVKPHRQLVIAGGGDDAGAAGVVFRQRRGWFSGTGMLGWNKNLESVTTPGCEAHVERVMTSDA